MSSASNKRYPGKSAALKARVREVSEKIGSSALSLALVLSLIPAPAIAYAVEEGVPEEAPVEETVAPEETPDTPEPQGEEQAPEATDGGATTDQGAGTAAEAGTQEQAPATDQGGAQQPDQASAPAQPVTMSEQTLSPNPADNVFKAMVTVNAGSKKVDGATRTIFSQEDVSADLAISAEQLAGGIKNVTITNVTAGDGVAVNESFNRLTTKNENGVYSFDRVYVTYTYTYDEVTEEVVFDPQTNEQTTLRNTEEKTAEATNEVACEGGILTVVVDKDSPIVTPWVDDATADTTAAQIINGVQTRWLDLAGGAAVAPKIVVDNVNFDEGSVTMTWVNANGEQIGGTGETVVKFDENGVAVLPALSESDFIDENGSLKYANVTFEGKDLAGNPLRPKIGAADISAIRFTSESQWLEDAKLTLQVPEGVKSATRTNDDGTTRTVYNDGVNVVLSGSYNSDADKVSTIKVTDNGIELAKAESNGVEELDAVTGSHQVTATLTTPHNAAKTISLDAFDIDMSVPQITAQMVNSTGTSDEGVEYYGTDATPVLAVTVVEGESTLNQDEPFDITLSDENGNQVKKDFSYEKTDEGYLLSVPEELTEYSATVTPKTIFGNTVKKNAAKGNLFALDDDPPTITLNFTGPMNPVTVLGKIVAGFFKATAETEGYDEGSVGCLTITVEDNTLKSVTITGVNGLKGEQELTEPGKYEITIPYIQTDDGLVFIGEGNDHKISVTAVDEAGNEYVYSYNMPDAPENQETILPGEVGGESFVIDTTPVESMGFTVSVPDPYVEEGTNVHVYNADSVDVTVTVKDANFNTDGSHLYVSTNGGDDVLQEGVDWTDKGEGTYSATVTLTEDKEAQASGARVLYNVKLVANDLLGNATTHDSTEDKIGPIALYTQPEESKKIKVAYSPEVSNKADNGIDYYSGDSLTATITVTDPFFDKNTSKVDELGSYGSWGGKWTEEPEGVWTTTVTYSENVDLDTGGNVIPSTLKVVAKNLMGNTEEYNYGDEGGNKKFIVDNTAPVVQSVTFDPDDKLVGTIDKTDYYAVNSSEDELVATIEVYDINLDKSNSIVTAPGGTWGSENEKWAPVEGKPGYFTTKVTYKQTNVGEKASFTVQAVDMAKKEGTGITTYAKLRENSEGVSEATAFVIDADKGPDISVRFTGNDSNVDLNPVGTKNNINYYDEKPTATITVTDRNFDPDNSSITANHGEIVGQDSNQIWKQDGEVWTATVKYDDNNVGETSDLSVNAVDKVYTASGRTLGDYKASWAYSDLTDSKAPAFVVDTICPAITVSISQPIQRTFNGKDFYADDVEMTLTVVDNNFDSQSSVDTDHASQEFIKWDNPSKDGRTYTATVKFGESANINSPADLKINAYDVIWAIDNTKSAHLNKYDYRQQDSNDAKKVKTEYTGEGDATATGFIVDTIAPRIEHVDNGNNPSAVGAGIQFFNQLTSLRFYFADDCGLSKVELEDPDGQYTLGPGQHGFGEGDMSNSSPVTMQLVEKVSIDRDAYDGTHEGKLPVKLMVTDITGNSRIWTIDSNGEIKTVVTENANKQSNANISIDNKGIYPAALVQDTTPPVVSLSPKSLEGTFSNQTQTVTATIDEFNFAYLLRFDGNRTVVRITKQEGNAGRAQSVIEIPASAFSGSGSNWSYTHAFETDGHYVVEAQFKDYAENLSNMDRIGEFTIDKTPPVIESIVYDNNDVRNGRYYKAGRTATITIIEHNWDPSLAIVTTNGVFNGWVDNGDVHIGTVSFLTDGDYNLSVAVSDKAGNAADKTEPEFTVDLTAPTLEFYLKNELQDPQKPTAYADDPLDARIVFMDEKNFESGEYTVTSNKESVLAAKRTLQYPTPGNNGNGSTVNFVYPGELEYDDIYTLKAKATDLAGNEVEKEYRYSLNRFGSNFEIVDESDYKDEKGNTKYLKDPQTVQVREVNVTGSKRKDQNVSVTHGLDTDKLKQQDRSNPNAQGFYVDASQDQYQWAEYMYNVYEPNFPENENGLYSVIVTSKDTVDNHNTSDEYVDHDVKAKPEPGQKVAINDATVEFILDMEKPIIDNVNFDDGKLYNHHKAENANLTFTVTDNFEVDEVKVKMDDGTETTVKPVAGSETEYSVPMEAKTFTKRAFSIIATDKAGNERELGRSGLRNTANFFELYWPFILGVAAAGSGGAYAYARRRRNEDEQE